MKGARHRVRRPWREFGRSKHGTTALELGLVSFPFLLLVLGTFEVAFDLYTKAVLDTTLVQAARQIQTGNSQNALNGSYFVTNYLCPGIGGLLTCSNVYVQVQRLSPTSSQDFYDFTTGQSPVSNGVLNLTSYASAHFCNSGPAQLLLISAVYVGPTFVGPLIPGFAVSYNGSFVHSTFASVATVTESYSPAAGKPGAAASC